MEILDVPPKNIIEMSTRKKNFFGVFVLVWIAHPCSLWSNLVTAKPSVHVLGNASCNTLEMCQNFVEPGHVGIM